MKMWHKNEESEERNLFLLDHYETVHKGIVIGCIDHHPNEQKKSYAFCYVRNSCATAYLVYELMQVAGYPINKEEAKMIIVSMMVDTISFRSSKTIGLEVEKALELAKKFCIDYDFLEKYSMCLTQVDKMVTEQIISNGQKWYYYNSKKVGSAYVQLYGMPTVTQLEEWIASLNQVLENSLAEMLVFIIFDIQSKMTYEIQILKDCIKEVKRAGILSRGKDVMPAVEKKIVQGFRNSRKIRESSKKLA